MLEVQKIQEKAVDSNVDVWHFFVASPTPKGGACNIGGPPLLINEIFDQLPRRFNSVDPVSVHGAELFIWKKLLWRRQPLVIVLRACAAKLNLQAVFGIPDSEGFVVLQATSAFLNYVESFGNVIQADFAKCNVAVKDVDEAATGERLDSVVVCIQALEDGLLALLEDFVQPQVLQCLRILKTRGRGFFFVRGAH